MGDNRKQRLFFLHLLNPMFLLLQLKTLWGECPRFTESPIRSFIPGGSVILTRKPLVYGSKVFQSLRRQIPFNLNLFHGFTGCLLLLIVEN